MEEPYKLLVEGKSDSAVIRHLMMRHGYDWNVKTAPRARVIDSHAKDDEDSDSKQRTGPGTSYLLPALRVNLKVSGTTRLGVVVDADGSVIDRWRSICDRVGPLGVKLPPRPDPKGTIVDGLFPGSQLGIWLMPDNLQPGELEHFLLGLIPEEDPCKAFASEVAEQARKKYDGQRCTPGDHVKSHMHTWLAWQLKPGLPFGTALNDKQVLRHDSQTALAFKDWFLKLFPM